MSGISSFLGNLFGAGSSSNNSPKIEARPSPVVSLSQPGYSSPVRPTPTSSPLPIRAIERVDSSAIPIVQNPYSGGFEAGCPKVYSVPLRKAFQVEEERESLGMSLASSVVSSFVDRDIFHFDMGQEPQEESEASPDLHTSTVPSAASTPSYPGVSDFYPQALSTVSSTKKIAKPPASHLNQKVNGTVLADLKSLSGASPLSSLSLPQHSTLTSDSSDPSSFSSPEDEFVDVDLKSVPREPHRAIVLRKSPIEIFQFVNQGPSLEDSPDWSRSPQSLLRTSPIDENGQETECVLKASPLSDSTSIPPAAATTAEVSTGMRRSNRVFAGLNSLSSFQQVVQGQPVQESVTPALKVTDSVESGMFDMDDF